jgi:hypothetical protein
VHQLTNIQRVEQLFSLPSLTAQKLSELLAEMLRLSPRRQENNAFFNCLFLNKLPSELHILLLEADMEDKQALGAIAGLFTAHNSMLMMWWLRWPPALSRSKERSPQWRRCAPEPAAASAAVVADSEAAVVEARRSPAVVAVGGSVLQTTGSPTRSRPVWRLGRASTTSGAKSKTCHAPCTWSGN